MSIRTQDYCAEATRFIRYRIRRALMREFNSPGVEVGVDVHESLAKQRLNIRADVYLFCSDGERQVSTIDHVSYQHTLRGDWELCLAEVSDGMIHRLIEEIRDDGLELVRFDHTIETYHADYALAADRTAIAVMPSLREGIARVREWAEHLNRSLTAIYPRPADILDGIHRASEESDKRARELFKLFAGEDAYRRIEQDRLMIAGSAGGHYIMRAKAVDSVTNSDGSLNYCVTVHGVPLYDALLATKLLVEHDEPRFLKTANVTRACHDATIRYGGGSSFQRIQRERV